MSARNRLICSRPVCNQGRPTARRAVRVHGGYGFAKAFHVERSYRESILSMIAPLSQELALCHIAEHALGLPKSY